MRTPSPDQREPVLLSESGGRRARALGPDSDDQSVATHAGDKATFAAVYDELQTVPFFAPRRIVVVEGADPFVTRFRSQLEKNIDKLPPSGVLVLDVKALVQKAIGQGR